MNISILYGHTVEDHIPMKFELIHPHQETYYDNGLNLGSSNIKQFQWNKASEMDIAQYSDKLDSLYKNKLYESFLCSELNCTDKSHIQELSSIYSDIMKNVEFASSNLPTYNKILNDRMIIGWNTQVKFQHDIAREAFMIWHNQGKPRDGDIFEKMRQT